MILIWAISGTQLFGFQTPSPPPIPGEEEEGQQLNQTPVQGIAQWPVDTIPPMGGGDGSGATKQFVYLKSIFQLL